MENKAIENIQANAAAILLSQELSKKDLPALVAPENLKLIDIQQYLDGPQRHKGKYVTDDIGEFFQFVSSEDNSSIFVNTKEMSASAIFDFGSISKPEHQEYTANLLLKRTDEFKELRQFTDIHMSQQQAIEFIEEWHPHITALAKESEIGKEPEQIDLTKVITAIRSLKVQAEATQENKIEDLSEEQSTFSKVSIGPSDGQGQIPAYIDFTCTPYSGLEIPYGEENATGFTEQRTFRLRFTTLTGRDKPQIKLNIIRMDKHEKVMGDAFRDQIKRHLDDQKHRVYIGNWSK